MPGFIWLSGIISGESAGAAKVDIVKRRSAAIIARRENANRKPVMLTVLFFI